MEKKESCKNVVNLSSVKLIRIIEYMAKLQAPARLLDISKDTNINVSTVSRFLNTLKMEGYIDQENNSGKYYMTYKICSLSNNVSYNFDIRTVVKPYLQLIADSFSSTCNLVVEVDSAAMYLEVVSSQKQIYFSLQRIGRVAPLHCTGAGKLFLLDYDTAKLNDLLRIKGFEKFTSHTLTDLKSLLPELKQIQNDGYAYDNEECEIGARCIAVPIYDYSNKIIAAISVSGQTEKMTDKYINEKLPFMLECSRQISKKIGYSK